jgi:glycosyltransferase involved in cell wall biosynthesis
MPQQGLNQSSIPAMTICVIGVRGLPGVVGGIETYTEQVFSRLVRWHPQISVTVIARTATVPARRYRHNGLNVVVVPTVPVSGLDVVAYTFVALLYARFVTRPDLVALQGIGPGFFSAMARCLGLRTTVTHHARDFHRPKWGAAARMFLKAGEFMACAVAHRIICVSASLVEILRKQHGFASGRLALIRNGSDAVAHDGTSDGAVLKSLGLHEGGYILAVGRLEATKGFHDLIAAHARSTVAHMPLVIAGEAHGEDRYLCDLRALAGANVRLIGAQFGANLRALYGHAALFVHPSYMEGFGLVVAEALSHRRPVLLSNIAPHLEFGLDSRCYFPVGDVDALTELLNTPDFAVFRPAQQARGQLNSWDDSAAAHLALFRDVVLALPPASARTERKNDQ